MGAVKKLVSNRTIDFAHEAAQKLSAIIQREAGIWLKSEKSLLIQTRLQGRLNYLEIYSLADYVELISSDKSELQVCIELLTTHKTEWFREIVHFQWMKQELIKQLTANSPIHIWSAACSSGAEVYSLLFLMLKMGFCHDQVRVLGSDISTNILEKAINLPQESEFAMQKEFLLRSVRNRTKVANELELSLQRSIRFKKFNLVTDHLNSPVRFDIIFLRNVLIYFDRPTVIAVCKNLGRYLKPNGYLVIGISESLFDELPEFKSIGNSIYQYRPGGGS